MKVLVPYRPATVALALMVGASCGDRATPTPTVVLADLCATSEPLVEVGRLEVGVDEGAFGAALCYDAGRLLVGAPGEDAAYLYQRDGADWVQRERFAASEEPDTEAFGEVLALAKRIAVVGSPADASQNSKHPGAAHVFQYDGERWTHTARLTAPKPRAGDFFGTAAATDGERILVGACGTGDRYGAAYVFEREGASWVVAATLVDPHPSAHSFFGENVAFRGNVAFVGASTDESGINSGSVLVFARQPEGWQLAHRWVVDEIPELALFGSAVAAYGESAIVGAHQGGPGGKGGGMAPGAAFLYQNLGAAPTTRFIAGDVGMNQLGQAVAIDGRRFALGAREVAYVLERSASGWSARATATESNGMRTGFATAIALDGDDVLVAVPYDGAGAVRIYR